MEVTSISCPTCESLTHVKVGDFHDVEMYTVSELFSYYNCKACDSIFIYPAPIEQLDKIYPDNYYSNSVPNPKAILNKIKDTFDKRLFKKILQQIPGEQLSVLDVGGGSGWMLNLIKKTDNRITYTAVVDLNEKAAMLAKNFGHEFHCQRIESFESQKKFDLIVMFNLIEHVSNPGQVLSNMASLLTSNGKILIKTPNTKTLDRYLFQKSYWGGYHCPRHWVLFNEESIKTLAFKNNLSTKWVKYTQGAPQWAMSLIGMAEMRKPFVFPPNKNKVNRPILPFLLGIFAALDFIRLPFMRTAQMFVLFEKIP